MSAQTESWPRPHRLTVHDYYRMAEVGLLHPDERTELIEGEIVDMPPIGSTHASVVTLLTRRLVRAVGDFAAEHHIREYWVVDLVERRVVRHRAPSRAGYRRRDQVASGALPLPAIGAELSLAELF
jgi:Uma2 family endonuclease